MTKEDKNTKKIIKWIKKIKIEKKNEKSTSNMTKSREWKFWIFKIKHTTVHTNDLSSQSWSKSKNKKICSIWHQNEMMNGR